MRTHRVLRLLALAVAVATFGAFGGPLHAAAATKAPPTPGEVSPAGDIPDTQAFVPYLPTAGGFTLSVPEGWARSAQPTGALFTDKFNSVAVEQAAAAAAPTLASVQAEVLPTIRATGGSHLGRVAKVARRGGHAIRITYVHASAADPTTGKKVTLAVERYLFWKSGSLVSITLSGAKGADNVDPWRTVTDSFAWSP